MTRFLFLLVNAVRVAAYLSSPSPAVEVVQAASLTYYRSRGAIERAA